MAILAPKKLSSSRFQLDTRAVLNSMGVSPWDPTRFFKARKIRACQATPFQIKPSAYTRAMKALTNALSRSNAPKLDKATTAALYAFIMNPSDSSEIEHLLKKACALQAQCTFFDLDNVIKLMKRVSTGLKQWQSQILASSKVQCLQMHEKLKNSDFKTPAFNAMLKKHLEAMRAHLKAVIEKGKIEFTPDAAQNSNIETIFDHIEEQFAIDQAQTVITFLYKRKFGTNSENVMRYLANNTPSQRVMAKASVAIKKREAELKAAPELYFENTRAIDKKKADLIKSKQQLKENLAHHQDLQARYSYEQNLLQALKKKGSDKVDESLAKLAEIKRKSTHLEKAITTSKMAVEALEYEVQMARLAFAKSLTDKAKQDHLKTYYKTKVLPIVRQSLLNFHYHYDCKTLLMHDMTSFAADLGLDPAIMSPAFANSKYAKQIAFDDKRKKAKMRLDADSSTFLAKKGAKKLLTTLKKRTFYLPGSDQYVQGLAQALDLFIACSCGLRTQTEHTSELAITKKLVREHIINLKADEYFAKAMLVRSKDLAQAKQKMITLFNEDIATLRLGDKKSSASSSMLKRLHKKTHSQKSRETLALSDMHGLIETYTAAKERALAKLKKLTSSKHSAQSLHYDSSIALTSNTPLSHLMAIYPGRVAQFDQVIAHYRKRCKVDLETPLQPMSGDNLLAGSNTHINFSSYYGKLRISQIARFFNPAITAKQEEKETKIMLEQFRQIAAGPAIDEMVLDYAPKSASCAHTPLPPPLVEFDKFHSLRDKAGLSLYKQLCHRFAKRDGLKYFPYLKTLYEKQPETFFSFKFSINSCQAYLRKLINQEKKATPDRHITLTREKLLLFTRKLTRDLLKHTFDANASSLHPRIEELGYFVESLYASILKEAVQDFSIDSSKAKSIASQIQVAIKQGIVDHTLDFTINSRSADSSQVCFANLINPSNALATKNMPRESKLVKPFIFGCLRKAEADSHKNVYALCPTQLYATDPLRQIDAAFVRSVLNETAANSAAINPYLNKVQRLFNTFKDSLELKTEGLEKSLALFDDQFKAMRLAADQLKKDKPRKTRKVEQDLLQAKVAMLQKDFLAYEQMLDPANQTTAWKKAYTFSTAIMSKILSYRALKSDQVNACLAEVMEKLRKKRAQLQKDHPSRFDKEWESVLSRAASLIDYLVVVKGEKASIHSGSMKRLSALLAPSAPSLLTRIRNALPF